MKFTLMSFEADFDEGIETKGSEIQVEIFLRRRTTKNNSV